MQLRDEYARQNLKQFREEVASGADYARPWFDLDVAAFRACREGHASTLPPPWGDDPVTRLMLQGVPGKNVLCLAGAGGQQSAVYALLGARVTVLDLTPEMLERDQVAARHYGYEVTTVQGDMRDLSSLPTGAFDRVDQPISTLFVPDLEAVYRGVARVLAPGGLYAVDFAVPLLYMAEDRGWDGQGYNLRVDVPYRRGKILESRGRLNFDDGEFAGEFHHLLSDILNGIVAAGMVLRGVWERPRPDARLGEEKPEPGSEAHRARYVPFGLTVVAMRPAHRG